MDFPTKRRSNAQVGDWARRLRAYFGITNTDYVDVLACLKSQRILAERGEKRLVFEELDDSVMGADDARTVHTPTEVKIQAKKSVAFAASIGDGRARHTLAHELGHAVMHSGEAPKRKLERGAAKHPDS